jgi:hypothetical protein
MHKSNLPNIIASSHNEVIQSFLIYNKLVFLGLRNGYLEIFEHKTNLKIGEIISLFDNEPKKDAKELKFNPHTNQIVNISLLHENIEIKEIIMYIQSRGGIIFIIKYNVDNNVFKLLKKYDTKIESFLGFFMSNKINKKEWELAIKNVKAKNIYKIFCLLEKENEIDILFYDINDNSIEKLSQNFDYIIDEDGQKILDVYKDMESKISQIIPLSKYDNSKFSNYIVMIYEKTLIFILDENLNYVSHYSISFSLKLYEAVINIYSFKFNNNYFICIGLFARNLIILRFDPENNHLNFYQKIENICPEIKYGISCFTNGIIKNDDLFMDEDLIQNKFLLFVGTYSKRIKIIEINSDNENEIKNEIKINDDKKVEIKDNIKFKDLGNLIVDNSGSINQIDFYEGYLFVACDRKILYIYSI